MGINRTEEVIRECFEEEDGQLKIGDLTVHEIVQRYGTPLYVYDARIIKQTYRHLRTGLAKKVELFYSLKANPSLAVCGLYADLGAGAEIGSIGEFETALKAGFPRDRIVFAGPGKGKDDLRAAIDMGILSINVESIMEIEDIAEICAREGTNANISIRINPKSDMGSVKIQMGGGSQPFGIDEERIDDVLDLLQDKPVLNLVGIHVYAGTQILDYKLALKNIKNTLLMAERVNHRLDHSKLQIINLGGGLGVPYYKKDTDFDSEAFVEGLNDLIEEHDADADLRRARFILELGRLFIAKSGIYLAKIQYIKESRGKWFAVLNGGMHQNAIATGNLGQPVKRKFPLCIVNKLGHPPSRKVDIVGPLCTPLDSFGSDIEVPEIERGDIIGVFLSGAYSYTASPVNFLSHPACGEIMIEKDYCQWIRVRGKPSDVLNRQSLFRYPRDD